MAHIDSSTPKPKLYHRRSSVVIFICAIVLGFLAFLFMLFSIFTPDNNNYQPISIGGFDSTHMSSEHRAGDVSEWVKDVADNMKPSDERSTFADTVSNYYSDGEIDAGEYDALLRVYELLKTKSYNDVINDSLIKIDATPNLLSREASAMSVEQAEHLIQAYDAIETEIIQLTAVPKADTAIVNSGSTNATAAESIVSTQQDDRNE